MAFGFLGDIVEGIGDVVLGPKGGGQRGAKIGAAIGSVTPVGPTFGAAIGSQLSQAIDSPTPNQSPQYALESPQSGSGLVSTQPQYMPDYSAMMRATSLPVPRVPTPRPQPQGPNIMDFIPDITISKFFGDSCGQKMPRLVGMTRDGCPTVTRKQQRVLRNMAQYMPLESVAYEAGVDVTTMARLISKTFPARSKGISGAQLKTANRVNNKILSMAHRLGYDCKPMTTTKRGCK